MAGRGSRSSTDILTQRAPHVEVHRGLGCKERTHRQEKQERRKEEMEKVKLGTHGIRGKL